MKETMQDVRLHHRIPPEGSAFFSAARCYVNIKKDEKENPSAVADTKRSQMGGQLSIDFELRWFKNLVAFCSKSAKKRLLNVLKESFYALSRIYDG
jgi:hypothetical protein